MVGSAQSKGNLLTPIAANRGSLRVLAQLNQKKSCRNSHKSLGLPFDRKHLAVQQELYTIHLYSIPNTFQLNKRRHVTHNNNRAKLLKVKSMVIQTSPSPAHGLIQLNTSSRSGTEICETVALLLQFCTLWKEKHAGRTPTIAWIFSNTSFCTPSPIALSTRGIPLHSFFLIESSVPQRALNAVCSESCFDAIVYNTQSTAACLQLARRWLKPTHQPLVIKGSEFLSSTKTKLIIFTE